MRSASSSSSRLTNKRPPRKHVITKRDRRRVERPDVDGESDVTAQSGRQLHAARRVSGLRSVQIHRDVDIAEPPRPEERPVKVGKDDVWFGLERRTDRMGG